MTCDEIDDGRRVADGVAGLIRLEGMVRVCVVRGIDGEEMVTIKGGSVSGWLR